MMAVLRRLTRRNTLRVNQNFYVSALSIMSVASADYTPAQTLTRMQIAKLELCRKHKQHNLITGLERFVGKLSWKIKSLILTGILSDFISKT